MFLGYCYISKIDILVCLEIPVGFVNIPYFRDFLLNTISVSN